MLKIIFLILSSFLVDFINRDYVIVSSSEPFYVVDEIDCYSLLKEDQYYLSNGNKKILIGEYDKVNMFLINEKVIIIASYLDELYLISYDKNLVFLGSIELIRNGVESFYATISDDYLVVGGVSDERNELTSNNKRLGGKDAFLIILKKDDLTFKTFFYGGTSDEEINLITLSDYIYFVGKKSSMGEGDFGNGGKNESILLGKIDYEGKLISYKILDRKYDVRYFNKYKDEVYLVFKDGYLVLDSDFNIKSKKNVSEEILGVNLSKGGLFCLFSRDNLDIIDLNSGQEELITHNLALTEVNNKSSYISVKGVDFKKVDVIDINNSLVKDNYNEDKKIESLFGDAVFLEEEFSPPLNKQIYGDYEVLLSYETIGKIKFSHKVNYYVPLEVNIMNNGIYPLGYHLSFTGKAYLDGKQILNNYSIVDVGKHSLVLIGASDEENQYEFYINSNQIEFIENPNKIADIFASINEKITFKFKVDFSNEVEIDYVEVNEEKYEASFDKLNRIIYVPYKKMVEVGEMKVVIGNIYYHDEERSYSKLINEEYIIKVVKDNPLIKMNSFDGKTIIYDSFDSYNTLRFFRVTLVDKRGEEKDFLYPLATSEVIIDDLEKEEYLVKVSIVSDRGLQEFDSVELASLKISGKGNLYLGSIQVLSMDSSLNRFSIDFDSEFLNNDLKEIKVLDSTIFVSEKESLLKYIMALMVVFVIGLMIPLGVKGVIVKVKKK